MKLCMYVHSLRMSEEEDLLSDVIYFQCDTPWSSFHMLRTTEWGVELRGAECLGDVRRGVERCRAVRYKYFSSNSPQTSKKFLKLKIHEVSFISPKYQNNDYTRLN